MHMIKKGQLYRPKGIGSSIAQPWPHNRSSV